MPGTKSRVVNIGVRGGGGGGVGGGWGATHTPSLV